MISREWSRSILDKLAEKACVGEPTIERYSETVYYKRDYYERDGENRKLIHKAGDIRYMAGTPVLYTRGLRKGQPRQRYHLDLEVMGEILEHIYPYCEKSVTISFGYPDLEMITTLQIEIIRLLEREGPQPLGSSFSKVLALKVNNLLTTAFQHAKRNGKTELREVREAGGGWKTVEVLASSVISALRFEYSGDCCVQRHQDVIGGAPSFEDEVFYADLVSKLRQRVSGKTLEGLDTFLAGDADFIPYRVRKRLQREVQKLTVDSYEKGNIGT